MATLWRVDGTCEEFDIEHADLVMLQEAVGGYVEYINVPGGALICNEDGKMKNLSPNFMATRMLKELFGPDLRIPTFLLGNVILVPSDEMKYL